MAAQPAAPATAKQDLEAVSLRLERLTRTVTPAVVEINTLGYASTDDGDRERGLLVAPARGSGSGVIVDPAGYIITNGHVVAGAFRIQVQTVQPFEDAERRSILRPRGRLLGAQLVALDEETDLAVLKVPAQDLPAMEFADSDNLAPGQMVLAFGSPLGLSSSVSLGVVSATGRQLEPESPMVYVQTDASINPGNSGGPLVDLEGRLVGINTFIFSQSGGNEGIGFAAPSNIVRTVFEQIRKFGRVRRGEIGVRAQTITPLLAEGLGLARDRGVILTDVLPGGPAARAGARRGDLVLSLDGKAMENGRQLRVNLYGRLLGDTVRLDVLRGTETVPLFIAVGERTDDPARFGPLARPEEHMIERLGALALTVTPAIADELPALRVPHGVLVAAVGGTSSPEAVGRLEVGDLVHAVNGSPVRTLEELRQALAALRAGQAAVLQVEREGELVLVGLRIDR